MYQVWTSEGGGALRRGPRFRSLEDALRNVQTATRAQSFAIQCPDGSWHRDGSGGTVFLGGRRKSKHLTIARGSGPYDLIAHGEHLAAPLLETLDDKGDDADDADGDGTDVRWPPGTEPKPPRKIFG